MLWIKWAAAGDAGWADNEIAARAASVPRPRAMVAEAPDQAASGAPQPAAEPEGASAVQYWSEIH